MNAVAVTAAVVAADEAASAQIGRKEQKGQIAAPRPAAPPAKRAATDRTHASHAKAAVVSAARRVSVRQTPRAAKCPRHAKCASPGNRAKAVRAVVDAAVIAVIAQSAASNPPKPPHWPAKSAKRNWRQPTWRPCRRPAAKRARPTRLQKAGASAAVGVAEASEAPIGHLREMANKP